MAAAVVVDAFPEQLNRAYKIETDADVKERILLVRRVRIDGLEASKVAEKELRKSRWWAYKWLNRFDKHGLDGLKDQPRSGRPPFISEKKILKVKQELSENQSGWEAKQVMDIDTQKDGCQVPRSTRLPIATQVGILTKGASEEICKYRIRRGKKGF